jgi:hypothetical protein
MITMTKDDEGVTFEIPSASGVPERIYFPGKPDYYCLKSFGVPNQEALDGIQHLGDIGHLFPDVGEGRALGSVGSCH